MEEREVLEQAPEILDRFRHEIDSRIENPRHIEVTGFDDGDFRLEVKHGNPTGELTDEGFEILEIQKVVYKKSEGVLKYVETRQTERNPSNLIVTEEILEENV